MLTLITTLTLNADPGFFRGGKRIELTPDDSTTVIAPRIVNGSDRGILKSYKGTDGRTYSLNEKLLITFNKGVAKEEGERIVEDNGLSVVKWIGNTLIAKAATPDEALEKIDILLKNEKIKRVDPNLKSEVIQNSVYNDVNITSWTHVYYGINVNSVIRDKMVGIFPEPANAGHWFAYNKGGEYYTLTNDFGSYYVEFQKDIDCDILETWVMGYSGKNVKVGMIESGIDPHNPDLSFDYTWNVAAPENWERDLKKDLYDFDHGTEVASVIVAKHNNDFGIAGVAEDADLIAVDGFNGSSEDLLEALDVLDKKKARVVNCSWGTGMIADTVIEKMRDMSLNGADGKGVLFVFASGNDGTDWKDINYLATNEPAYEYAGGIHVGAIFGDGKKANYSVYGGGLDFVAPSNFLVTNPNYLNEDYSSTWGSGTSFAAPVVTGVVALMLEANPDLTRNQIVEILAKTAKKVGDYDYQVHSRANVTADNYVNNFHKEPWDIDENLTNYTWNNKTGYGLINAEAAVREAFALRKKLPDEETLRLYNLPSAMIESVSTDTPTETCEPEVITETVTVPADVNESEYQLNQNDIDSLTTGWHLMGVGVDTNISTYSNAKLFWAYKDGKWQVYSPDETLSQSIKSSGYDELETVPAKRGVWVLK
jgi:subtilisin family serine protease